MEYSAFEFFRKNGYLDLGQVFTGQELTDLVGLFDSDREEFKHCWRLLGQNNRHNQTVNCDVLVTSPVIDGVIRHPQVFPLVKELMGDPGEFAEISLRYMPPFDAPEETAWHRDRARTPQYPLGIEFIQLMVYLTDVTEQTHCFSISPEAADDPVLNRVEQLARGGVKNFFGPAGTAILFNVSCLHTATLRPTASERKSIQVYYGHPGEPALSDYSLVPATLWRDHPDPEVRAFYGRLNHRTRTFARAFEPHPNRP